MYVRNMLIMFLDQAVLSFALEPYGSKFAVLHGEPPARISFSCYELSHKRESVYRISKITSMGFYNHV